MCTPRHESDIAAGLRERCPERAAHAARTDHCDPHRLTLTLLLYGCRCLQLPASTRTLSLASRSGRLGFGRLLASNGFAQHGQNPIEAMRAWQAFVFRLRTLATCADVNRDRRRQSGVG